MVISLMYALPGRMTELTSECEWCIDLHACNEETALEIAREMRSATSHIWLRCCAQRSANLFRESDSLTALLVKIRPRLLGEHAAIDSTEPQ